MSKPRAPVYDRGFVMKLAKKIKSANKNITQTEAVKRANSSKEFKIYRGEHKIKLAEWHEKMAKYERALGEKLLKEAR